MRILPCHAQAALRIACCTLALVLLALPRLAHATPPMVYGVLEDDTPRDAVLLPSGSIATCGVGSPPWSAASEGWLRCIRNDGTHAWSRWFGGDYSDWLEDVVVTPAGDLLAAGHHSTGVTTSTVLGWLVSVAESGDVLFERTSSPPQSARFYSVAPAMDGGYFVAGAYKDPATPGPGFDHLLMRVDESLDVVWQRRVGSSASESITRLVATSDGGALAIGFGQEVIRFDRMGDLLWQRQVSLGATLVIRDACELSDGSLALAGEVDEPGGGAAAAVARLSSEGRAEWYRTVSRGSLTEFAASALALPGGGVMVNLYHGGLASLGVMSFDATGAIVNATSNGFVREVPVRMLRHPSGELRIVGNWPSNSGDLVILHADSEGRALEACWPNDVTYTTTFGVPVLEDLALDVGDAALTFSPIDTLRTESEELLITLPCPPVLPDEVTGVRVTAAGQDVALSWDPLADAETYEVYRGSLPARCPLVLDHRDVGACGIVPTSWTDAGERAATGGRYYLVVGRNDAGRGPYGTSSVGTPTPAAPVECP